MSLEKEDKYLVARYSDTANGGLGGHESYTITSARLEDEFFTPDFPVYTPDVTSPVNVPGILDDDDYLDRKDGYDPEKLSFTSTDFEPKQLVYTLRRWIIEESTQPYTTKPDFDPFKPRVGSPYLDTSNPDGNNPWPNSPELDRGKFYKVSVQYVANEGNSAVSAPVYFKTESLVEDIDLTNLNGLRFDPERKTALVRSPGTASNRKTWTFSCWYKRGKTGRSENLICADNYPTGGANDFTQVYFDGADKLTLWGHLELFKSTDTFTDITKWHHIVVQFDTTESDNNNRIKVFYDGKSVSGTVSNTSQDAEFAINNSVPQYVGTRNIERNVGSMSETLDGYMSDVYLVDGGVLDCSVFGEHVDGGKWAPKKPDDIKAAIEAGDSGGSLDRSYKWSAHMSSSNGWFAGRGPDMAFNGNDSPGNGAATQNGGTITFNPPATIPAKSHIQVKCGTASAAWDLTADGGSPQTIANDGEYHTIIYNEGTTFPVLTIKNKSGNSADVLGIKLNGSLLADGPANDSRMWSTDVIGETAAGGTAIVSSAEFGFDGVLANKSYIGSNGVGDKMIWNNTSGLTGSAWRVWTYIGANNGEANVVNGVNAYDNKEEEDGLYAWVTIPANPSQIEIVLQAAGPGILGAVEVDGAILIDGPNFNTSEVWSDGTVTGGTFLSSYPVTKVFDGKFGENDGAVTNYSANSLAMNVVIGSSLRVYGGSNPNQFSVTLDGSEEVFLDFDDVMYQWGDVAGAAGKTLTSLNWKSGSARIHGVEVDGQILVDSSGGFGTNGFYLPFNPNAVGLSYSASTESFEEETSASGGARGVFSGIANNTAENYFLCKTNTTGSGILVTKDIDVQSDLTIVIGGASDFIVTINEGLLSAYTQTITAGGAGAVTPRAVSFTGTIQTLKILTASGPSASSVIHQIEVDGEALYDYNNIGVDDSGNENHFHDQNFAVGNTSQVWSQTTSLTGGNISVSKLFDGSIEGSGNGVASESSGANIDFTNLTASKFEVWCDSSILWYGFNTSTYTQYTGALPGWVTVYDGAPTSVDSFAWSYSNGGGSGCRVDAFRADGLLLLDANAQDTVLDNPVTDYVVGGTGGTLKNGNLNRKTDSGEVSTNSITIDKNKKYYFETVGSGSSSSYIGFLRSAGLSAAGFGTTLSSGAGMTPFGFTSYTGVVGWKDGDVVGGVCDFTTGTFDVFVNGSHKGSATFDNTQGAGSYVFGGYSGNTEHTNNYGQQPFVGSNVTRNYDNTVTIDQDVSSGFPGGTYELLTKKLVDWSTYGALYYHPKEDKVRSLSEIIEAHGNVARPHNLGYVLIEQGRDGDLFMRNADTYVPVRRPDQLLASIEDKLASLQSELAN